MASHISKTLVPHIVEDEMKSIVNHQHFILYFNNRIMELRETGTNNIFSSRIHMVVFASPCELICLPECREKAVDI